VTQTADYYATLGVSPGATDAEIRAAFRRMARQYHPDVNPAPDAAERFRAVVAAYEVLSDPAQRARYDAGRGRGAETRKRADTGRRRPSGGWATAPRSTMPPVRGLDRHSTLRIASKLLERGGVATLQHKRWERCAECGGFGRLDHEVPCKACGGAGFYNGRISDPCKVCWTSGTTTVCPVCDGRGGRWSSKRYEITIPAGAHYGQQLRLRGQGDFGPRGGPPGELYVELRPLLPSAMEALVSNELIQAALRRLDEWLDRFAPYPS
jgi:molecular chaperone DnaJ